MSAVMRPKTMLGLRNDVSLFTKITDSFHEQKFTKYRHERYRMVSVYRFGVFAWFGNQNGVGGFLGKWKGGKEETRA